jgi:hypothetical protein
MMQAIPVHPARQQIDSQIAQLTWNVRFSNFVVGTFLVLAVGCAITMALAHRRIIPAPWVMGGASGIFAAVAAALMISCDRVREARQLADLIRERDHVLPGAIQEYQQAKQQLEASMTEALQAAGIENPAPLIQQPGAIANILNGRRAAPQRTDGWRVQQWLLEQAESFSRESQANQTAAQLTYWTAQWRARMPLFAAPQQQ